MPNISCLNSIFAYEFKDWFDCEKNDINYQKFVDLIDENIQNVLNPQEPEVHESDELEHNDSRISHV